MADVLSKFMNFLIPEEVEEVKEVKAETKQEKQQQQAKTKVKLAQQSVKVANGPDIYTSESANARPKQEDNERPSLKVFKQPNMNVVVFEPSNFNDTRIAADALKSSKTVLINYEKIEPSEQVRICDFMNGACYVLDGSVKRISAKMVLYVPCGVAIESIVPIEA